MMSVESLESQEIGEGNRDKMYMSFKSGNECFALKIAYINEIFGFQKFTKSLESDSYIKGVINRRSKTIPVIDVRVRFGQDCIEYTDKTYIIVVDTKTALYGLIVDKVTGVVIIEDKSIFEFPPIGNKENVINKYLYGVCKINNEIKMLINPDKLINNKDVSMFEEMLQENTGDNSKDESFKRRKSIRKFNKNNRKFIKHKSYKTCKRRDRRKFNIKVKLKSKRKRKRKNAVATRFKQAEAL